MRVGSGNFVRIREGNTPSRWTIGSLEVGDYFRFLNKHGKVTGERFQITSELGMEGMGIWAQSEKGVIHIEGNNLRMVKPCHITSLLVAAKLKYGYPY